MAYDDFEKIDMRLGRVVEVLDFPEARNPAVRLGLNRTKEGFGGGEGEVEIK